MSTPIYTDKGLHVASFTGVATHEGPGVPASIRRLQFETPYGPVQLEPLDVAVLVGMLIQWLDSTHYRNTFLDRGFPEGRRWKQSRDKK